MDASPIDESDRSTTGSLELDDYYPRDVLVRSEPQCPTCKDQHQILLIQGFMLNTVRKANMKLVEDNNRLLMKQGELLACKRELEMLKSDPEFMTIIDYQRKKRRHLG